MLKNLPDAMHRPNRSFIPFLFILIALASNAEAIRAQEPVVVPPDSQLVQLSESWLELLDAGNFKQSLDEAAPLLQRMTGSVEGWRTFLQQARPVPADSVQRDLLGIEYDPDIPGAPEGQYVTVSFSTDHPAMPAESVVLQAVEDDWKVSMYFLRSPDDLDE